MITAAFEGFVRFLFRLYSLGISEEGPKHNPAFRILVRAGDTKGIGMGKRKIEACQLAASEPWNV